MDRAGRLARTLEALGSIDAGTHERVGGGEVVVVDNASGERAIAAGVLANGWRVRVERLGENIGAAARNVGAELARGEWVVMLDDDSHPVDGGVVDAVCGAPGDVAAVGGEIFLADGRRESGGLPEVVIGCGVAVRRGVFLEVGGYDGAFHYYAEEYDLCARLICAGWRIMHDGRFRVVHEKVNEGRDMGVILGRLVRNNGWVAQRYAPDSELGRELEEVVTRYRRIAEKEGAVAGYERGLRELEGTLGAQERRAMTRAQWERFTGMAQARAWLGARVAGMDRVAVVDEGKNAWVVRAVLGELGVREDAGAAVGVVGTMSPGAMMDAQEARLARGERAERAWRGFGGGVGQVVTSVISS